MKKMFSSLLLVFFLATSSVAFAQPMMGRFPVPSNSDSETTKEEQEGFQIWQKLQSGEVICQNLSEDDYELLGEYFMGTMMGDYHEAMNQMMVRMMGKQGEEQMHITMGKRMSSCDTSAQYPQGFNFMPMMGGWLSPSGFNQNNNNNSMMWGYDNPMGWGFGFGLIFMILFWGLIIWGIFALVRGATGHGRWGGHHDGHGHKGNNALDILKERYAKGEITKEDFERMKKDLE